MRFAWLRFSLKWASKKITRIPSVGPLGLDRCDPQVQVDRDAQAQWTLVKRAGARAAAPPFDALERLA
jgi:hypothetical protein